MTCHTSINWATRYNLYPVENHLRQVSKMVQNIKINRRTGQMIFIVQGKTRQLLVLGKINLLDVARVPAFSRNYQQPHRISRDIKHNIVARVNKIVCSTGSTNVPFILEKKILYAYFCYSNTQNNYHLVLSTGNINLRNKAGFPNGSKPKGEKSFAPWWCCQLAI